MRTFLEPLTARLLQSRIFWIVMMGAVLAGSAISFVRNRLNGDVAWYLYAVHRLYDGAALYRDIQDINMPIVYLMYMPLIVLDRLTGIPTHFLMLVSIWGLVGCVLVMVVRIPQLSFAGRSMLVFATAYASLSVNRGHIGQRDPICGLLFVGLVISAYVAVEWPRETLDRWAWLITFLASFALALKPYFLLPWALVAILLVQRMGLRKAVAMKECWMPPLFSVLSWIATVLFFPGYLAMATLASRYYAHLNADPWLYFPLLAPLTVSLIALRRKVQPKLELLVRFGGVTVFGFMVESVVQGKAAPYHMAPSMYWSMLVVALMVVDHLDSTRDGSPNWTLSSGPVMASVAVLLAAESLWSSTAEPFIRTTHVDRYIQEKGKGKLVLTLSAHPWTAFPLIYEAKATNARPDSSLWLIGGMYRDQVQAAAQDSEKILTARYHDRAEMLEDERVSFENVVGIMTKQRPEFIIVQIERKWGLTPLEFNFLDYYSTDSRFRDAFRSYSKGPGDCLNQVYVRNDLQIAAGP